MPAPPVSLSVTSAIVRRVLCTLAAVAFAAGALSCASTRPATRVRVVPAPVIVAPPVEAPPPGEYAPPLAPGAPPASPDAGMPEAVPAPLGPVAPAAAPERLPAPPTSNVIALVLPLDEPSFARAAGAVRDGFLDAAAAAGRNGDCIVIPHGRGGVVDAFALARAKGVRVAVGPLVRDDLRTLAGADVDLPWTLALNQLDDDTRLPAAIYTFSLTVESDGRTLARRARALGARAFDVVEGGSPLMKRLAASFATEWTTEGGGVPQAFRFDAAPDALTALRRELSRNTPDAVLLAVDGEHAGLVKPFIGGVDAYASGLVFERPSPAAARDLDGVRVMEIPWLLTPDAPQFAGAQRREFDSESLSRLYALGLDAFRIAASFRDGPPGQLAFDGATGHVSLGARHEFEREGLLGVYREGVLVPFQATP